MSSDEMRTELEIFVNEGLREGWRGWPLKSEVRQDYPRGDRLSITSLRVWHGGRRGPACWTGRSGRFAISA